MLDALDCHESLDARGSLIGSNRVVLVVEQLLVLGDDEQFCAVLAAADVFDGACLPRRLGHSQHTGAHRQAAEGEQD